MWSVLEESDFNVVISQQLAIFCFSKLLFGNIDV